MRPLVKIELTNYGRAQRHSLSKTMKNSLYAAFVKICTSIDDQFFSNCDERSHCQENVGVVHFSSTRFVLMS